MPPSTYRRTHKDQAAGLRVQSIQGDWYFLPCTSHPSITAAIDLVGQHCFCTLLAVPYPKTESTPQESASSSNTEDQIKEESCMHTFTKEGGGSQKISVMINMTKINQVTIARCEPTREPVGYLDPTRICKMQHTVDIRDDSAVLKDKSPEKKKKYIEKLRGDKSREVGTYIGRAKLSYQDKRCIMALYNFN
ncbi:hypothetical protein E2562_025810 [Oryza meyeriana var. granulata]|uniref:Uncharacterized protein n=1 Tax=Oryza meyeriana var. granulata TaxID=110450 RepID=A0A6G1E2P5_9ORYZ|nr:hypothetical protein E2562_025810 [Oryza meyeriana var. granulata]